MDGLSSHIVTMTDDQNFFFRPKKKSQYEGGRDILLGGT